MKIVHVNTSDINGGAAIAAHRLHLSMLKQGIDSKMLVLTKNSDELNIQPAISGNIEKHIFSKIRGVQEKLVFNKYKNRENPIMFSSGQYGIDISQHPYIKEADIIHLHWINSGYLSLKSIEKLGKLGKKIRWTLHDMWAFTGGCHYAGECKNYEKKCGNCPILGTEKENDITRKIWERKEKIFKDLNIEIITCSNWLGECAKNSSLLKDKKIVVQANILDTNIFKSLDNEFCKEVLNLDNEKQYICFGAMSSTGDPRKGWEYLNEALILLDKENPKLKEKIELLVFGASHGEDIEKLPFKTKFLGRVHDESTLALIYNSANVFVGPSLEEAFGQTFNESINCGTPAVAFEKTGVADVITHKENGYLAKYKDVEDLVEGIKWGLGRKKI